MNNLDKTIEFFKTREARPLVWFSVFFLIEAIVTSRFLSPLFSVFLLSFGAVVLIMILFHSKALLKNNKALMLERNQNKYVIDSLSEGIIVYDQDFQILSLNKAAEVITGVRQDEILGKKVVPEWATNEHLRLFTQIIFPSLAPVVIKKNVAAYPQIVEIRFLEPRELYLEITTNQVFNDTGQLIGFIRIVRDRSREIQLLKTKSEFITVAAHQLRTPLVGIKWALETINKKELGDLNEQQRAIVLEAYKTAERLSNIIDNLLNVAQIEEGKFGYQFEKADLVSLTQEVLESYREQAKRYRVKLLFFKPPEILPPITMDKNKIALVMQNLVENAIRYNVENGEVRVRIERLSEKPYIQVSVEDTGIGIPPKDLPRLFSKFFRAENVLKKETQGSGLGLFIARNIVKRHGGDIWVKSVQGRGSTFYFVLPMDETLIPPTEVVAEETT